MKTNIIYILMLFTIPVLMAAECKKRSPLLDPFIPTVKLSATVSDTAEIIHLGDTLRIKLIVPDTLNAISKKDGTIEKIAVSNLQECIYSYNLYLIDTSSKSGTIIRDAEQEFVTEGRGNGWGNVWASTTQKPYTATINIVPKLKGLYTIDFGGQETLITANNNFNAGLRVNMDVTDKHWAGYARVFGFSNTNGLQKLDNEGFGFYCFWVQ